MTGFHSWEWIALWGGEITPLQAADTLYLLRVHVEFLPAHGDLFVSLGCFTATQKHKRRRRPVNNYDFRTNIALRLEMIVLNMQHIQQQVIGQDTHGLGDKQHTHCLCMDNMPDWFIVVAHAANELSVFALCSCCVDKWQRPSSLLWAVYPSTCAC